MNHEVTSLMPKSSSNKIWFKKVKLASDHKMLPANLIKRQQMLGKVLDTKDVNLIDKLALH